MSSRRQNVPKDRLRGFSYDRGARRCNKLAPCHRLNLSGSIVDLSIAAAQDVPGFSHCGPPIYGPGVTGTTGPVTDGVGAVASAGNGVGSIRNQATTPIKATNAPTERPADHP